MKCPNQDSNADLANSLLHAVLPHALLPPHAGKMYKSETRGSLDCRFSFLPGQDVIAGLSLGPMVS